MVNPMMMKQMNTQDDDFGEFTGIMDANHVASLSGPPPLGLWALPLGSGASFYFKLYDMVGTSDCSEGCEEAGTDKRSRRRCAWHQQHTA